MAPKAPSHRSAVGPAQQYDRVAGSTFSLLVRLGLREHHSVLDVGCGSLRIGRLLIPYLLPGCYCGIEPREGLVTAGIEHETGRDIIELKRAQFNYNADLDFSVFGQSFDVILAHSIWSHMPARMIRQCLAGAREHLNPDGFLIATYNKGRKDSSDNQWSGGGVRYRQSSMIEMAAEQDLHCQPLNWTHPGSQRWLIITPLPCKVVLI